LEEVLDLSSDRILNDDDIFRLFKNEGIHPSDQCQSWDREELIYALNYSFSNIYSNDKPTVSKYTQ